MAPIKKEREGWGPGLRWPPLDGSTQQLTKGWRRRRVRGGCNGALGHNKGVGRFPIVWGVELSDQKNENRESDGVLGLDGHHQMGGHINQPIVVVSGLRDIGEET